MSYIAIATAVCLGSFLLRLYVVMTYKPHPPTNGNRPPTCHLAVFLGSGGHTSEALAMLSALDFTRYTPRTYMCSESDALSAKKAFVLESVKAAESSSHPPAASKPCYTVITIPRARSVHQPLLTTPFTALRSLVSCLYYVAILPALSGTPFAEVLVLNGPGTCCMLALAVYFERFLGLPSPTLIYVESFARVRSLSLSGKLLRPFVDRFVVQWPDLLQDGGRGECRDWLV